MRKPGQRFTVHGTSAPSRVLTGLLVCAAILSLPERTFGQGEVERSQATSSDTDPSAEAAPGAESPAATLDSASATSATARAVEHYRRGREHYLAGRYPEALEELRTALALDPASPNLVYNVARVNEDLGNLDEAISSYERYLTLIPRTNSSERAEVDKTLRRLRGAKQAAAARDEEDRGAQQARAPLETESAPGRADWAFWATASAGVALVAIGGVAGILALQRQNDVGDFVVGPDGTLDDRRDLVSQADGLALASDVCFVGGAVALTGAALLYFLRDPEPSDAQLMTAIGPNGVGGATITLSGAF